MRIERKYRNLIEETKERCHGDNEPKDSGRPIFRVVDSNKTVIRGHSREHVGLIVLKVDMAALVCEAHYEE
jgi:hypothetical protein